MTMRAVDPLSASVGWAGPRVDRKRVFNCRHDIVIITVQHQLVLHHLGGVLILTTHPSQSYINHSVTGILWIYATMSDATLPPPRSSSAVPTADVGNSSDSNSAVGEFDTSLDQLSDSVAKEEVSSGLEGRAETKQRRKRTRYAFDIYASYRNTPFIICKPYIACFVKLHGLN